MHDEAGPIGLSGRQADPERAGRGRDGAGSLRPQAAKTLRRLLGQHRARHPLFTGEGLQAAGHEADAVTTALDLTGIPRAELRHTRPGRRDVVVELLPP